MSDGKVDYMRTLFLMSKEQNLRYVINMASGMGHIAAELDNFRRMKYLNELNPDCRYALILPRDPLITDIISHFSNHFEFISDDPELYRGVRDLLNFYPELAVDIGISDYKLIPMRDVQCFTFFYPDSRGSDFVARTPWPKTLEFMRAYYRRYAQSLSMDQSDLPLLQLNDDMNALIEPDLARPLALIQIKEKGANSTAESTQPKSLFPLLATLRDMNYKIVLAGREVMPNSFRSFGVINYAGSPIASRSNDMCLFANASIAIINGSGLAHLADLYGVPYLFINHWHAFFGMPSPLCVEIPAIAVDRASGHHLSFSEQTSIYTSRGPFDTWSFPSDRFTTRQASGIEILEGFLELSRLRDQPIPLTERQEHYRQIDPLEFKCFAQSRVCDRFLIDNDYFNA